MLKKDWVLTQQAFDKLLACLNQDRALAAECYEKIRRKLITFFESRGCFSAEELTDTTINRVARRLSEGAELYAADPSGFFFGVARRVLQEHWDERSKSPVALDAILLTKEILQDPAELKEREANLLLVEQQIKCLEKCLEELPPDNRDLIIKYYQGESSIRINNRKKLAERFGIQVNTLRLRALRIREKLEACFYAHFRQLPVS